MKGHKYGCLICDLPSKRPIDILPSRTQEDVQEWLESHPTVKLVSRDSSFTFKRAIDETSREIIQVSDRFHLIQNLRKTMESVLKRLLPDYVSWSNDSQIVEADTRLKVRKQRNLQEKKKKLIEQVKQLHQQQMSISKIAKLLHLDPRTVKKYSQIEKLTHGGRRGYRPSLIDPFVEELQQLVRQGYTNKEIDAHLRTLGFTGNYSTVRIRIEDYRRLLRMGVDTATLPSKKNYSKLKRLFLQKKDDSTVRENRELLESLFNRLPHTKHLYNFYHDFLACFSKRQIRGLRKTIIEGLKHPIEEIQNYCKRLYQDIDAIENSLRYSFNNGLLEGQVNRLKTIKRMMYGRAGVALLRTRMLFQFT